MQVPVTPCFARYSVREPLDTTAAHASSATVAPPSALGCLTPWRQGQAQPNVATLTALDRIRDVESRHRSGRRSGA